MKTPREILFTHHRSATPKLDAIRHEVVAHLPAAEGADESVNPATETMVEGLKPIRGKFTPGWRRLLPVLRWHLAGMSAAWLLVLLLDLDNRSEPAPRISKQDAVTPQQLMITYQENRRQLSELFDAPIRESVPTPVPVVPTRRSDIRINAEALA
jgi:hypothetical protein